MANPYCCLHQVVIDEIVPIPLENGRSCSKSTKDFAARSVAGLRLDNCRFNIELLYDANDVMIRIIEVNTRLCGQSGDLFRKVDGGDSHVTALAVATGNAPGRYYRPELRLLKRSELRIGRGILNLALNTVGCSGALRTAARGFTRGPRKAGRKRRQ